MQFTAWLRAGASFTIPKVETGRGGQGEDLGGDRLGAGGLQVKESLCAAAGQPTVCGCSPGPEPLLPLPPPDPMLQASGAPGGARNISG